MNRLAALSLALVLLADFRGFAEDPLGHILERVYVPDGATSDRARIAPPGGPWAPSQVTEGELLGRIEKELVSQCHVDGDLRLNFDRPWRPLKVPAGDWQVTLPELPVGGLSKAFVLRVHIAAGERVVFDQLVVLQAQLWKPALVATRRVERGQTLEASAAEVQTIEVLRDHITPVPANTRIEDQEALQTIAEGRPLTPQDIAPAPLVHKGAIVDVTAGDGNMSINMKGLAMGTGGAGDPITIRNMDTHKDFQARVVSRNSVRVTF